MKILSYSDPFSSNDGVRVKKNKIHLKKPKKIAFGRLQLRDNSTKTTNRKYIVVFVDIRERKQGPGTCTLVYLLEVSPRIEVPLGKIADFKRVKMVSTS